MSAVEQRESERRRTQANTRVSSERPQRVTQSKKSKHETIMHFLGATSERPRNVPGTCSERPPQSSKGPLRDLRGTTEVGRSSSYRKASAVPDLPKASRCAVTHGLGVYPCPTAPRRENWGYACGAKRVREQRVGRQVVTKDGLGSAWM